MKKPAGSLISFMSNLVKTNGGINCAQGIPGFNPPKELLQKLKDLSDRNVHQYPAGNGIPELKKIIASGLIENSEFTESNILITNGATEAISIIYLYLRQLNRGHLTTLSFDPVYESYSNLPKIYNDRFITAYPENDGSFNFELVEKSIAEENVKLIIVCSPGNPYGKIWKKEEIKIIHQICKKHGSYLIFDAVYSNLYFNEKPYLPFDIFDETVFFVSAFSKMLSITGWRVGYIVSVDRNIENIARIHDYTGLCSPSVLQYSIAEYLAENDFGMNYLNDLRKKIRKSYYIMSDILCTSGFLTPEIDGGYFIWTKIPERFDNGFNFALELYEKKKIGVVPGIHFSEKGTAFIRISIAKPENEISEAGSKIREFVNNQ